MGAAALFCRSCEYFGHGYEGSGLTRTRGGPRELSMMLRNMRVLEVTSTKGLSAGHASSVFEESVDFVIVARKVEKVGREIVHS
jgi:hypothetical protein